MYLHVLPDRCDVFFPQAKFLKACGTLLDTPVEIREASGKWMDTSPNEKSSSFKSWLPNSSSEQQPDEPLTCIQTCQEWAVGIIPLVETPGRYICQLSVWLIQ